MRHHNGINNSSISLCIRSSNIIGIGRGSGSGIGIGTVQPVVSPGTLWWSIVSVTIRNWGAAEMSAWVALWRQRIDI